MCPLSETIIWNTYKGWIKSYRDLPLFIQPMGQCGSLGDANAPIPAYREFLWQEGHTAHAHKLEVIEETERMLEVYRRFAEEWLAMPVIKGVKTASERGSPGLRRRIASKPSCRWQSAASRNLALPRWGCQGLRCALYHQGE